MNKIESQLVLAAGVGLCKVEAHPRVPDQTSVETDTVHRIDNSFV